MLRRTLALLLTAALASPGPLALAQPSPAAAKPNAAAPPASIDDLLDQAAGMDMEPQGVAPIPQAERGLNSEQLDMRIRGASAAAQALQGPMDGAWSLRDEQGAPLYTFQFADPANNPSGVLEGAWRDLRREAGPGGAGLISTIERGPGRLQATFKPNGSADGASVNLVQGADGAWTGQLIERGAVQRVRMIRTEPMLNAAPIRAAGYDVVSPYRTPASNTRAAAPAKGKKGKAAKGRASKTSSGKKASSAKRKKR